MSIIEARLVFLRPLVVLMGPAWKPVVLETRQTRAVFRSSFVTVVGGQRAGTCQNRARPSCLAAAV